MSDDTFDMLIRKSQEICLSNTKIIQRQYKHIENKELGNNSFD